MKIVEIKSEKEFIKVFLLVKELRPHLSYSQFRTLLEQISGYTLFGVLQNEEYITFAGVAIMVNLYFEKHIWVFEMFTLENHQLKGIGTKLMDYIIEYGKKNAYKSIALSSSINKELAHKFYEQKVGFEKVDYLFKKDIWNLPFLKLNITYASLLNTPSVARMHCGR